MDRYNTLIIDELIHLMQRSPDMVEPGLSFFSATRHLEGIADHATNIAEDVIYLVEGAIVRHQPAASAATTSTYISPTPVLRRRGDTEHTDGGLTANGRFNLDDDRCRRDADDGDAAHPRSDHRGRTRAHRGAQLQPASARATKAVVAHDGQEGLCMAQTLLPDLILLDLMLPVMTGLEVCRELKAGEPHARHSHSHAHRQGGARADQVVGFSLGADDHVTKPFSVKVLMQRIKALQRLSSEGTNDPSSVVEHLGVRIDRLRHRAFVSDKELTLTPTDASRLLECLQAPAGPEPSRGTRLMDAAIGEGQIVLERTIDVHIKTLR